MAVVHLRPGPSDPVPADASPPDVGTAAVGSSTDYAREDHTHGIVNDAVTNVELADVPQDTFKGRATAGTGDPEDLTAAQARTVLNVADGANNYVHPNHSGDVTSSGDGAQTIVADAVDNTKIRNSAGLSVIGRSANTLGDPADIVAGSDLQVLRRSGSTLGFGQVQAGGIADNAVTNAKIRDSAALSVIGRATNSTGDPADIGAAQDGHVLRRASSVLGFGTVATAGIANDAVDNTKLSDMVQSTVRGRAAGAGTGDPQDLTVAQLKTLLTYLASEITNDSSVVGATIAAALNTLLATKVKGTARTEVNFGTLSGIGPKYTAPHGLATYNNTIDPTLIGYLHIGTLNITTPFPVVLSAQNLFVHLYREGANLVIESNGASLNGFIAKAWIIHTP